MQVGCAASGGDGKAAAPPLPPCLQALLALIERIRGDATESGMDVPRTLAAVKQEAKAYGFTPDSAGEVAATGGV